MVTQLLFNVLIWALETFLSVLGFVVPPAMLDFFGVGASFMGHMLSFGPAGIVGIAIAAYMVIDTSLNAFVFAVNTYRLIPAKAS